MKCMPYPVTSSFVLGDGVTMKTPPTSRIPTTVLFEHHRCCVDAVDDDDKKQKVKTRSVVDDDVDDALLEASFTAFLKRRKANEALFLEKEGDNNVADVAAIVLDSSPPVKEVEAAVPAALKVLLLLVLEHCLRIRACSRSWQQCALRPELLHLEVRKR